MIVYAGKQFWNEFNNGDEALFQDAGRPRDDDMFKIRPWYQTQKMDWKTQATNTWATAYTVFGYSMQQWYNPDWAYEWYEEWFWWKPTWRMMLKSEYSENDLAEIKNYTDAMGHTWTTKDALEYVKNATGKWDAKTRVTDSALEITETWTYILKCFADFIFPWWYSFSAWSTYPLFLALLTYDPEKKDYVPYDHIQARSCAYIDRLSIEACANIPKWARFWIIVSHWYTTHKVLVTWGITATRIN